MAVRKVRLLSTDAGFTVRGTLYILSVWFILALRFIMASRYANALGAGRILGLDAYVEQREAGGRPSLVDKHPWTRDVLE